MTYAGELSLTLPEVEDAGPASATLESLVSTHAALLIRVVTILSRRRKSGIGPEDLSFDRPCWRALPYSRSEALPIGAIDIVGSTRHIEVSATVEQETGR